MLFASKTKGYFVEENDHAILLARTSAPVAPFLIEQITECGRDAGALLGALQQLQPKKAPSGYLNATCAVYPARRIVRRASLEPKRYKDAGYLEEVLTSQFRIAPDAFAIHVLNAPDGTDFDLTKPALKEVLFCGMPADDVVALQDRLLERGIYPDRVELGSVALLGGLVDYLAFTKSKTPTLVLEVDDDATHSYIVSAAGVEASRPISQGLNAMVPLVQKELGLKDEESARKLFFSGTFDFTGMGPLLVKKLLKELQSSIGFYEVQTGQSVGQLLCTLLPPKLGWLEGVIATALGVANMPLELRPWLESHQISLPETTAPGRLDPRWFGLLSLMVAHNTPDALAAEKKE